MILTPRSALFLVLCLPAVALGQGISKVPGNTQVSLGGSDWD